MAPKPADPTVRQALVDAAARTIAEQGWAGLSLRGLAHEVGTSTMAIYTHFGSMGAIRRAVQHEGYSRLLARLDAVEATDDPLADLILLGWAYFVHASSEPNLFRAVHLERRLDGDDTGLAAETLDRLVTGVRRCLDADLLLREDAGGIATQLWALVHGVVALQLTGALDDGAAFAAFTAGGANLLRALGADPDGLERSITAARDRADPPVPA